MGNKLNQNGKIERALCTFLTGIIECNAWVCPPFVHSFVDSFVRSACSNNTILTPILFAELLSVVRFYRTIKTKVALFTKPGINCALYVLLEGPFFGAFHISKHKYTEFFSASLFWHLLLRTFYIASNDFFFEFFFSRIFKIFVYNVSKE